MKKIFLLLFLFINSIASIEIKKEQYLKYIKSLKPEVKNLVEKLENSNDFLDQLLTLFLDCGEPCALEWCKQTGFILCENVINSLIIVRPLYSTIK